MKKEVRVITLTVGLTCLLIPALLLCLPSWTGHPVDWVCFSYQSALLLAAAVDPAEYLLYPHLWRLMTLLQLCLRHDATCWQLPPQPH